METTTVTCPACAQDIEFAVGETKKRCPACTKIVTIESTAVGRTEPVIPEPVAGATVAEIQTATGHEQQLLRHNQTAIYCPGCLRWIQPAQEKCPACGNVFPPQMFSFEG